MFTARSSVPASASPTENENPAGVTKAPMQRQDSFVAWSEYRVSPALERVIQASYPPVDSPAAAADVFHRHGQRIASRTPLPKSPLSTSTP